MAKLVTLQSSGIPFQSPATAHAQCNSHVFVHQRQWLVPFLNVAGMERTITRKTPAKTSSLAPPPRHLPPPPPPTPPPPPASVPSPQPPAPTHHTHAPPFLPFDPKPQSIYRGIYERFDKANCTFIPQHQNGTRPADFERVRACRNQLEGLA